MTFGSARKRSLLAVAILFLVSLPSAQNSTPAAGPELLTLHSRIFHNTRTIRVWLPPQYYDKVNSDRRYPVFYFTDGIATFHGRQLDRVAERLIQSDKIPPAIFVGIDNGGSTRQSKNPGPDRANEYLPYPDDFLQPPLPNPHGRQFPDFLEKEVRPLVESRYRTSGAIGIAGASTAQPSLYSRSWSGLATTAGCSSRARLFTSQTTSCCIEQRNFSNGRSASTSGRERMKVKAMPNAKWSTM